MPPPAAPAPAPAPSEPQALTGYRTNAEWNDLLAQVGAAIASLEDIPDPAVRDEVQRALRGIDEIHREALHRLVRLFKEGVLKQVVTDPAIRTLMSMYDLLPHEEPGCAKTFDFLTQEERGELAAPAVTAANPAVLPHWTPAPLEGALADDGHAFAEIEGHRIVVARVRGEDFAVDAHCDRHGADMAGGRTSGYSWICPHGLGCAYDLRNGARIGGGPPLACHPVRRDEHGRLLVGFGMPFKPNMPSF